MQPRAAVSIADFTACTLVSVAAVARLSPMFLQTAVIISSIVLIALLIGAAWWRHRLGPWGDRAAWREAMLHLRVEVRRDVYFRGIRSLGPYCLHCLRHHRKHHRLVQYHGIYSCHHCNSEYDRSGGKIPFQLIADGDEVMHQHWFPGRAGTDVIHRPAQPASQPAAEPKPAKRKRRSTPDLETGCLFEMDTSARTNQQ